MALTAFLAGCCPAAPPQAPPAPPAADPPGSTAAAGSPPSGAPLTIAEAPKVPGEPDAGEAPSGAIAEVGAASGWPTFHGDPARTGASSAAPIKSPRIRWHAKVGIMGWLNGPLALGKNVVVVPSSGTAHNKPDPGDGVVALDLRTGKRLWHAHFDQDANGAAATADKIFATSDDGHLYALDARTGKVLWKQQGSGKMYSYPLPLGDQVIVGDAGGYLRAHAMADGKERWKVQLTGAIRGGASADAKYVYVASQGGEVAAVSPSGKVAWRQIVKRPPWDGRGADLPIDVYAPPVVMKDGIVVTFARDTYYKDVPAVYALDKNNGKVKWRAKGPGDWGNVRSTPALVAGALVYGEPYSGDVVGISAANGRLLYRKKVGECFFPQWASPAAAGDVVYLPRFDGAVYAVQALSGKVLWDVYLGTARDAGKSRPPSPPSKYGCEWDLPVGHPIYSPAAVAEDGTLLVGTGEGELYAIGD